MNAPIKSEPEGPSRRALISCGARAASFALILALLPVADLMFYPFGARGLAKFLQCFYKTVLFLFGIKVEVEGTPCTQRPTLFVSNHTSYLDVSVLGSILTATFVAKADVAQWPVIGWLVKLQNTAFVERRPSRAVQQKDLLVPLLQKSDGLIFFPEGTTTDGFEVLPFKSTLFSLAEKPLPDGRALTVQPISVFATDAQGGPIVQGQAPYYAWFGDMTLIPHLWSAFLAGSFTVRVIFHSPVTIKDFKDRKEMAAACHNKVEGAIRSFRQQRSALSAPAP